LGKRVFYEVGKSRGKKAIRQRFKSQRNSKVKKDFGMRSGKTEREVAKKYAAAPRLNAIVEGK